ncbi:P2X purinoceptor 1 [Heteronotia binoei]|uniref:P2X purinoceptor 1 n=1 Tax=Heteronotia binoei TaxID=13085 RepID=UPI00292ED48E|nr:P2X purinoceptor 1 [Heteronotia binoei]
MGQKFVESLSSFFFEYDTPRMVLVRNKKVGLTFRLIQLVVLAYIIGWVFLYEKGYQSRDGIVSSVSVKLKGLTLTNVSGMGPHIWDGTDYVFPPQGDSSFVVMTNFIITQGQKQGRCPENPETGGCVDDSKCTKGKYPRGGQGIMTGKCVNYNSTMKTCEIFGWCPVEFDDFVPNPPLLLEAESFTLFIKNSITFPKFKVSRRNLVERVTKHYLRNCTYHKVRDPLCPVFELGYIVEESGQKFSALAQKGGVVGITISWDCDLDWPVRHCIPIYNFHGLYNDDNLSPGFNFRYAKYYRENGSDLRTLYKVFGIRFDILVNGKAGKFDIIPTMTTIGSGIGIFGVASVLCDLLLLHFLPKRDYYKQKKFKYAEQDSLKQGKEEAISSSMCNLQEKEHASS